MKRFIISGLLIMAVITACGGGGGGGEGGAGSGGSGTGSQQYTRATVRLSTSGTTTYIGGVDATLVLPAGVTVQDAANPPLTDTGVVAASGQTAAATALVSGNYSAAGSTVQVIVISEAANGFGSGEYVTVNCDIAAGSTPVAGDFTISKLLVKDRYGATIGGVTATVSVSFL